MLQLDHLRLYKTPFDLTLKTRMFHRGSGSQNESNYFLFFVAVKSAILSKKINHSIHKSGLGFFVIDASDELKSSFLR